MCGGSDGKSTYFNVEHISQTNGTINETHVKQIHMGDKKVEKMDVDEVSKIIAKLSIILERLARHWRAMTCSLVIGRKVVDILQDFMLWINSLRIYGIS
jgi:hypothetical protein